ncbi:hypothetical protein LTR84_013138 [Exophiala bonariae]|uniref:Methyltransferase domain-containing protein n=1 Tax=Exophiala bonariae TaxID=1690606 RepID=A0AAV9NHR0_9EURO|nr:hypothetical protein LTR84_013138 [Exophiala bonariae]
MSSPRKSASPAAVADATTPPSLAQDGGQPNIDVDDDGDSAFADGDNFSETTSLASSLIRGHIMNGRKYSSLRSDYWGPSDESQFESMDAGHYNLLTLDSNQPEPLFRSPVVEPQNILDIGTGPGTWAVDVADKYPEAVVYGVDLSPPPVTWMPPNCHLQVDDVLEDWTFRENFDLIHMRLMLGAFTDNEWRDVYRKAYDNLKPGGWIEQVELDVRVMADDNSLRPDTLIAEWGNNFLGCSERAGRPLDTQLTMKAKIEEAGFVDVQEHLYKCPIGGWPKNKVLKDAGRINFVQWTAGLEGWAMFLLTNWGSPEPWTADEVRVYVAKVREELKQPRLHIWHYTVDDEYGVANLNDRGLQFVLTY